MTLRLYYISDKKEFETGSAIFRAMIKERAKKLDLRGALQFCGGIINLAKKHVHPRFSFQLFEDVYKDAPFVDAFHWLYGKFDNDQELAYENVIPGTDMLEGRLEENDRTFYHSSEGGYANGFYVGNYEIGLADFGGDKLNFFITKR